MKAQNKSQWTPAQITQLKKLRASGATLREMAEVLGKSYDAVEKKSRSLPSVKGSQNFEALAAHWKKKSAELEKAMAAASASKTAVDVLCEQAHALAPKSYQPIASKLNFSRTRQVSSEQSAVLLLSDTHIGQVVHPEQTLGLGGYNFELFLRRLQRLETSFMSIVRDHTPSRVPEIVIPVLGDMLNGALTHAVECAQVNTMLTQFYSGGHALAQFLRNLSAIAPIRLYSCVGNHPRWQNQHKMPTTNRYSNYDQFLYLYVQALIRDIPNIKWHIDMQPFATFEVQGFPFYCGHGDNLRGGDKTLGIPNHSMGRMVSTTTQLFSRAGKDTPAYYCVGHLHRPISLPHANGEILVNGAFPGIDGFALNEYFNASRPMQRLFFMHPKFGKSAMYDLRLDLGDKTPHKYNLPDQFPCV